MAPCPTSYTKMGSSGNLAPRASIFCAERNWDPVRNTPENARRQCGFSLRIRTPPNSTSSTVKGYALQRRLGWKFFPETFIHAINSRIKSNPYGRIQPYGKRATSRLTVVGVWLPPDLTMARVLYVCCPACNEMQDKQYQANHQGSVNESGGHVECEKSEQPKNDQNCGDYSKHFLISLRLTARASAMSFFPTALMLLRVQENAAQTSY